MNIYQENGYKNRKDYLYELSVEYNVEFSIVSALADLFGPEEDFDGLVTQLQDCEEINEH